MTKKANNIEKIETGYIHQGTRPITPEEQAIAARVMNEGSEWQEFGEDSLVDFEFGRDMFELPAPAKKKQDNHEFAFRWLTRDPKRLDAIRNKPVPFRWWICNSTNTPFLEGFFDPVLGCVSREDQMLMFKPYWMRDAEWKYKRGLADAQDASGDILKKNDQMATDTVQWKAGKRSGLSLDEMKHEIRGGDVVMPYDPDSNMGQEVNDNDLIVEQ